MRLAWLAVLWAGCAFEPEGIDLDPTVPDDPVGQDDPNAAVVDLARPSAERAPDPSAPPPGLGMDCESTSSSSRDDWQNWPSGRGRPGQGEWDDDDGSDPCREYGLVCHDGRCDYP